MLFRIGKYFDPVKSELDVMVFRDTKWSGVVIDRDIADSSDRVIDGFISDSGMYFLILCTGSNVPSL